MVRGGPTHLAGRIPNDMADHGMRVRLARVISVVTISALIAAITLSSAAFADSGRTKLSKEDRERLATATANGASTVTMLFATVEGSTGSVASALAALGATVRKQDPDVGYIRADVPTDMADDASKLAGDASSELDKVLEKPNKDVR